MIDKKIPVKLILILLSTFFNAYTSEFNLELAHTKTKFNTFSIPQKQADNITLKDEDVFSYRLKSFIDLSKSSSLYILIAPLSVDYEFTSSKNFKFDGESFLANQKTKTQYQFNSYRVGYLWRKNYQAISYWYGAVLKIRDARIRVIQNQKVKSYYNLGFVPLLSAGFKWNISSSFFFQTHLDALAAKQGYAYDIDYGVGLKLKNYSLSIGIRSLGGGADNEKVFNFAQFDSSYLRISRLY